MLRYRHMQDRFYCIGRTGECDSQLEVCHSVHSCGSKRSLPAGIRKDMYAYNGKACRSLRAMFAKELRLSQYV